MYTRLPTKSKFCVVILCRLYPLYRAIVGSYYETQTQGVLLARQFRPKLILEVAFSVVYYFVARRGAERAKKAAPFMPRRARQTHPSQQD